MSTARRGRFGLVTLILIGAMMALGSLWLLEVVRRAGVETARAVKRTEPDYYVDNFNYVRMAENGEAQYNISGKRLVHDPVTDTHLIDQPVVNSLSAERAPMSARADRARVDSNSDKVYLYDNVQLNRPASPKADYFHLDTDYLVMLTDEEIMETDRPVHMVIGKSILNGTGMKVNNATGELHLASRVHAVLPPKTATR
ncbi:LPS export ABC transporter periplasmic protein LptC [Noviherbaspirillum pedocola]|uniref:LPS export ABC transporter periplasmic protein LptC n=1 Tax=Noviherbaspirillum pedocola TaxID=2801341 RepID=A0A934SRB7_9BURK|nr:LPS export ABC transporter periplasmic protein LptC [Noviherbaspirillum pedocola]MBK4733848.1 LPS export ABC transporter periplasmic protein LptC [Noviherbaspirillum pedocola]